MSKIEQIDFSTLTWVKTELDETLNRAKEALKTYVEDTDDTNQLQFCITYLHQIQGTLKMVELYGAAMVAEEMESVAKDLINGKISDEDAAFDVLMQSILQLPDYLERIELGHKDVPIVLLPLVNDLRSVRGSKLLSESSLFNPNLELGVPERVNNTDVSLRGNQLRTALLKIRSVYQVSLLNWIKENNKAKAIDNIKLVVNKLQMVLSQEHLKQLFWAYSGVLEGLQDNSIEDNISLKQIAGKVDLLIKDLSGNGSHIKANSRSITRNLLYYVAISKGDGRLCSEIRDYFNLKQFIPDEQEIKHAEGSLSGKNKELLQTVSDAIKDDVLVVQESLDLFIRNKSASVEQLSPLLDNLQNIADTLGILGLGVARDSVNEHRNALENQIEAEERPSDENLLDVAKTLLQIEAQLGDHIQSLGATEELGGEEESAIPKSEKKAILQQLAKESIINLQQIKTNFVAFIESPWDKNQVKENPRLLKDISGALKILNLSEASEHLDQITEYVNQQILTSDSKPSAMELEQLATVISSLEYYLENLDQGQSIRNSLLDVVKVQLAQLQKHVADHQDEREVLPDVAEIEDVANEQDEEGEAITEELELQLEADGGESEDEIATEETIAETVNQPSTVVEESSLMVIFGDDVDEEIKEVFLEEFEEELANMQEKHKIWKQDPDANAGELTEIRRIFHTLKGSGRLVGAEAIGEFGWQLENMCNRKLDNSISNEANFRTVLAQGVETAAGLFTALKEESTVPAGYDLLLKNAENVSTGQDLETAQVVVAEAPVVTQNIDEVIEQEVEAETAQEETISIAEQDLAEDESKPAELEMEFDLESNEDELELELELDSEESEDEQASLEQAEMLETELDTDIEEVELSTDEFEDLEFELESVELNDEDTEEAELAVDFDGEELSEDLTLDFETTSEETSEATEDEEHEEVVKSTTGIDWKKNLTDFADSQFVTGSRNKDDEEQKDSDEVELSLEDFENESEGDELTLEDMESEADDMELSLEEFETDSDDLAEEGVDESEDLALDINESDMDLEFEVDDIAAELDHETTDSDVDEELENIDGDAAEDLLEFNLEEESVDSDEDEVGLDEVDESEFIENLDLELDDFADEQPLSLVEETQNSEMADSEDDIADETDDLEVDPVFIEILQKEVGGHLANMEEFVDKIKDRPERTVNDDFIRVVHTLNGAASMAAVDGITQMTTPLEKMSKLMFDKKLTLNDLDITTINQVIVSAKEQMQALGTDKAEVDFEIGQYFKSRIEDLLTLPAESVAVNQDDELDDIDETALDSIEDIEDVEVAVDVDQVEEEIENAVEAVGVEENQTDKAVSLFEDQDDQETDQPIESDLDEELLEIFSEEASEIFDRADHLLAELEDNPNSPEIIQALQRDLHTLKGGARMAGLNQIGDLSHQLESLFESIAEKNIEVSSAQHEMMSQVMLKLHTMVNSDDYGQLTSIDAETSQLENILSSEGGEIKEQSKLDKEFFDPIANLADESDDKFDEPEVIKQSKKANVLSGGQIKVNSELLDKLVNFAGEVSIYRSRMEQQAAELKLNIDELENTVERVRRQLRELEHETEAQIISNYQAEGDELEEDFDPLELDQFSTIQQLSRSLSESVSDLTNIQTYLQESARSSETLLIQQSRVNTELQEGLMETRLVTFNSLIPRLRRVLRTASQELGKKAKLLVKGAEGEMDKTVLEGIQAPLEHMIRNAMVHGLEKDREAVGKPEQGQVSIELSREATEVVITVKDDGAGINTEVLKAKAISRGIIDKSDHLTDQEITQLITHSGLSAADEVTKLAGRGVGMDVVNNEIKRLGGSIEILSEKGQGTTFVIRLPYTLALTQAIIVQVADHRYAIPASGVQGLIRMHIDEFRRRVLEEDLNYDYAGEEYQIQELNKLLNVDSEALVEGNQVPLVMIKSGEQGVALRVDQTFGGREIVVKSVGTQVASVPGIFGATILGDGAVVLILDIIPMHRAYAQKLEKLKSEGVEILQEVQEDRVTTIMVVDDSITMRRAGERMLVRNDFEVMTAKDGLDALNKLQEQKPDLMLLDIEMPRMDGFELATQMKQSERFKDIPIIMITSRTGQKHKDRAKEIGVERYLGKPYQELELLENINDLLQLEDA
ncbi:MAG: Hpt domain-containing protein [Xanthomonadales bacterium]|nr:Hpt domain-containing protein [Xanthomonadales bacterium]